MNLIAMIGFVSDINKKGAELTFTLNIPKENYEQNLDPDLYDKFNIEVLNKLISKKDIRKFKNDALIGIKGELSSPDSKIIVKKIQVF